MNRWDALELVDFLGAPPNSQHILFDKSQTLQYY